MLSQAMWGTFPAFPSPTVTMGLPLAPSSPNTGLRSRFRKGAPTLPDQETIARAQEDKHEGKSASTQAGEFVREEMHHVREGKHGARSPQQAIAIGLSKARRAGVKLAAPKGPAALRKKAEQDSEAGEHPNRQVSAKRSRATSNALKREP